MSLLSRLLRPRDEGRAALRPLWHRVVAIAREPEWYAQCGIADTVPGRFDAITLVLALVLLRMEREPELVQRSVLLTEIFVDDMDGQLRESGVGDVVVGKHMGRLMSVLGGRLGALREALPQGQDAVAEVVARNVTLTGSGSTASIAARALALAGELEAIPAAALLAGEIPR